MPRFPAAECISVIHRSSITPLSSEILLRIFSALLSGRAGITEGIVGDFRLTKKVAGHLDRPYVKSPLTIREIMAGGQPIPDPKRVPGALRWDVPGTFKGSNGMWELVYIPETNTVIHFLFVSAK